MSKYSEKARQLLHSEDIVMKERFLVRYWGENSTLLKCMEECGGLIQACARYSRSEEPEEVDRCEYEVAEKIAAVESCMRYIMRLLHIDDEDMADERKHKLETELNRIIDREES